MIGKIVKSIFENFLKISKCISKTLFHFLILVTFRGEFSQVLSLRIKETLRFFSGDAFPLNLYYTLKHSAFSNSCCCFSHPHIQPPTPIRRYSSVSRDHAPVSFLLCALVCETTLLPFKFRNMQLFRKLDARIPLSTISRWIIEFSKINDPEIELRFSVTFFVEYF